MYYINLIPNKSGNYGNPNSYKQGYILPDSLLGDYLEAKGFVNIEVRDDTVVSLTINQVAYDAYMSEHPEYAPTPSEQRKHIYETEPLISWQGEILTIDEAEELFGHYFAEGKQETYETLQNLIAPAKAAIREQYPDV